jgi:hypothetical protein
MSQKSRNPKFKGKYFISVVGKFQFAVSSGSTGLLSLQHVGGLTLFLRIHCCLVNCCRLQQCSLCIAERYIRMQSYEAVKQSYWYAFLMLLYQSSQPFFDFLINSAILFRVSTNKTGHVYTSVGDTLGICCDYNLNM